MTTPEYRRLFKYLQVGTKKYPKVPRVLCWWWHTLTTPEYRWLLKYLQTGTKSTQKYQEHFAGGILLTEVGGWSCKFIQRHGCTKSYQEKGTKSIYQKDTAYAQRCNKKYQKKYFGGAVPPEYRWVGCFACPSCKNIHGHNRLEIPTKLRANYSDNRFNLTFKSIQINTWRDKLIPLMD